jgi:hypothetical protein
MKRRQFITAATMGCVAGCAGLSGDRSTGTEAAETTTTKGTTTPTGPSELDVGSPYTRSDTFRARISSLQLARTIQFQNGEFLRAGAENSLLLAKFATTNVADSMVDLPTAEALTLIEGTNQHSPLDIVSAKSGAKELEFPVSEPLYASTTPAHPDISFTGWVIFEVPKATNSVRIELSDQTDRELLAYWEGTIDSDSLPDLEIRSVSSPENHVNGKPVQFSVTVTNTGGGVGLLARNYSVKRGNNSTHPAGTLRATLDPGETVTIDKQIPARTNQDLVLSVPPNIHEEIDITPATRHFASPYTTADGVKVTVGRPVVSETVVIDQGADQYRQWSSDDSKFGSIAITTSNPTRSAKTQPDKDWFEVEADGVIDQNSNRGFAAGLEHPIDTQYYSGWKADDLSPGESISGVLYYDIPDSSQIDDITVRGKFPADGESSEVCHWSSRG